MKILLADDEPGIRMTLGDALHDAGHHVFLADSGTKALDQVESTIFDVVITDLRLPGADGMEILKRVKEVSQHTAVIVVTGYGTIENTVEAMKLGAHDYVTKPFINENLIAKLEKIEELLNLRTENRKLKGELSTRHSFENIIGESAVMQELFRTIETVADNDFSVLITGENGTGKELVAQALHHNSARRAKPLVRLSCAALPETLLEDELFGHERGAFTDARDKRLGRFEQADGGTIFLDDIDDMPLPMQVKLLRVLQEREFERLGGSKTIKVDIRVITATKVDLKYLVEQNRFREDLYYRLNVVPIHLPPLRERLEDLPSLVRHFTDKHGNGRKLDVSPQTYKQMGLYKWPGNVRELENAVRRAIVYAADDGVLDARCLVPTGAGQMTPAPSSAKGRARARGLREVAQEAEANHIAYVLELTGGNRTRAAETLEISRKSLWEKMKAYGLL